MPRPKVKLDMNDPATVADRIAKRKTAALSPENVFSATPEESLKYMNIGLKIMNLPSIDINDYEAVEKRLAEYFAIYAEAGTKPTVAGMANALNMDRRKLWAITHNMPYGSGGSIVKINKNVVDLITKAYRILEEMMENYMVAGKVNPVMGIFMAKNHFGYRDQVEHVVTPNTRPDNELTEADIKARYLTDGDNQSN